MVECELITERSRTTNKTKNKASFPLVKHLTFFTVIGECRTKLTLVIFEISA